VPDSTRAARSLYCALGGTLFLVLLAAGSACAQISPGPLAHAHRSLNGPTGCTECHAVSSGSPRFRCLDCHREIAVRLEQKRGLHATYSTLADGSAACVHCHSEHNGEDFSLLHWEPRQFKHATTGFTLEGKHAVIACNACHNAKLIAQPAGIKNVDRSFLGLSPTCTACHEDRHKGTLGANCLQCHTTEVWKPKFDHAKTRYPLTGAHLQVACASCHTKNEGGTVRYTGLRFERCSDCHNDPHRAAFAQTCESCHTTAAWRQTSLAGRFDHSKSDFPLLGKHTTVGCETCHRRADFKAKLAHDTCSACHSDAHNGQFQKRADGGSCESCHTVEGWQPSLFKVADHAHTGFPLRGQHGVIACSKCHVPAGRQTLFRLKFDTCLTCHEDVHRGQFAPGPILNRCEQCHDENTFHRVSFTLARHDRTRFPLTGAHRAVACNDCHKQGPALQAAAYHFDALTCATCHEDPHRGQFAARMALTRADGTPFGCEACHSTKSWQDLNRFDHSTTEFVLTGAHRAVECSACHRPPNLERTLAHTDFRAAPQQCEQCHDDPHGAQFARADSRITRCVECHTTMKWRPSLFDHETTQFSLKGAHVSVACKSCHVERRDIEGVSVLFYKPTPTKCDVCHGNTIAVRGKGV
jgi:hypothetical protein